MTTRELIDKLMELQDEGDISDFDVLWLEPISETWSSIEEIRIDRTSGTLALI